MNFGRAIGIRGVGFFSRGWHGGRDARVPSVARAGSASVSLAAAEMRCLATPRAGTPAKKPTPLSPADGEGWGWSATSQRLGTDYRPRPGGCGGVIG